MGIYLGAFGWVENLSPAVKVFVSPETLPPSLRPNDTHPVLEEDDVITSAANRGVGARQGGFAHAPSINHASAAALLRNAYLSHASPEQAKCFPSICPPSECGARQFVLEGMRNGQPIEALLGYQFERGLHDLTSAECRATTMSRCWSSINSSFLTGQAFPFESREVSQAGTGAPSETVPAYSVVNGLQLSAGNAYRRQRLWAGRWLGTARRRANGRMPTQGGAILAERDGLLDTLDAVKDLLMAENAFQLVRGNFDRVAAVSLAQKDAHIPPELEVIKTPRGSEFTFTNRVTLHFDRSRSDAGLPTIRGQRSQ